MEDTVKKKINFYKLILKKKEVKVDPITVFSQIKLLDPIKDERHLKIKDGKFNLLKFHKEKDEINIPIKFIFGLSKKKDLPCLEEKGKTEPLEIEDKGLFEPIHIILFPNDILGVESNYYGPRATGLKSYLLKKAGTLVDSVNVLPLTKKSFTEYIATIGDIKLFELEVHRNFEEAFKKAMPTFVHTLEEQKKWNDAQVIGIHLKSSKPIRANWESILNLFRDEKVREITQKAIVQGIDEESKDFLKLNLLEPFIVSTKEVVRLDDKYKRVDSKSMFNAIEESYYEKEPEINGITIMPKKDQQKLDKWKE